MGLDISHWKATLERPATSDPHKIGGMTEADFDGFDVPFSHFERYIQPIDCARIVQTTILVSDLEHLEYTQNWFKDNDYVILYDSDPRKLDQKIRAYESAYKLRRLRKHISADPVKWQLLQHYEIFQEIGFYQNEVGYQRKGMNEDFTYFYQDDKSEFVLREEFERAYQCVDYYWPSDTKEEVWERRKNFKENFLDNYEYGASTLTVSY